MNRSDVETLGRRSAGVLKEYNGYEKVKILDSYYLWLYSQDKSLTVDIARDGYWESWITAWVYNNVKYNSNVIDIGAHCGYYTALFSDIVGPAGNVYAYEPNLIFVKSLKMMRKANGFKNLDIRPIALSNKAGYTTLYIPGEFYGSASIVYDYKDEVQVRTSTLDRQHILEPDFIKIDAEGAEELIWAGGKRMLASCPLILMEYTANAYGVGFLHKISKIKDVFIVNDMGEEIPADAQIIDKSSDFVMLVLRNKS